MKQILGLDIGTNSIGAAILKLPENFEDYGKKGEIQWCTSRIIPVEDLQKFESGVKIETKASIRRKYRGSRRLKHRYKLRRTKLIKLFKTLGWLPEDFPLDNPKRIKEIINEYGKFDFRISDYVPISDESYREFYKHFGYSDEQLDKIIDEIKFRRNHNGKKQNDEIKLLPEDWIVYYLRKKGLSQKLTYNELIRIIYLLNQRRGFKSSRKDLKENETTIISYEEFKEKFKELKRNEDGEIIAVVKEEYENQNFETKFVSITKVINIDELPQNGRKGKKKFRIFLEDERIEVYTVERYEKPDWIGKEFNFLITQKLEKGKFKQNSPKIPTENDWNLLITALDEKIEESGKYVGEYFFDELVKAYNEEKDFKIRQNPVYRYRYEKELEKIWQIQCKLNPELAQLNNNKEILKKLAEIFYPTQSKFNGPKLKEFLSNDLLHVIKNDIIYYQRDTKSQKHLISECRYEKRIGKEKDVNGNLIESGKYGLKCIPKSSPLFQEFRIWQDIHNIRLIRKEKINEQGKKILDIDETDLYINETVKEKLFELFDSKEEVSEKNILEVINNCHKGNEPIKFNRKGNESSHRINLFRNRDKLKGNETKQRYRKIFNKLHLKCDYFHNNNELLMKLWHVDYSNSDSDKDKSYKSILSVLGWKSKNEKIKNWDNFKLSFNDAEIIAKSIVNSAPFPKEYGSYSALAIRKLLIFMRTGKYWKHPQDIINEIQNEIQNEKSNKKKKEKEKFLKSIEHALDIADKTFERLKSISFDEKELQNITDEEIPKQILKSFIKKRNYEEFIKGLNTYQAGYLLYGKHSEIEVTQVSSPEEYSKHIEKILKPGSLRNPIVESVVRETCALVKDIWKKFGQIDEIHIELARELKHNKEERAKISKIQNENFEEKQRIKKILYELLNNEPFEHYDEIGNKIISGFSIKPNPENPEDIQRFRLWQEQALLSKSDGKKEKIPKEDDIKKYILWLSQKCRSPYSGKIIPISKLFDGNEYQIDHIIPRSKMKNDALSNLVIVESKLNQAKGNELAANFIANRNGYCEYNGESIEILKYDDYKKLVDDIFKNNRTKRKNLLATEVPNDFIERQINDTRYIGKKLGELLRPVLKDPNSIIFTIGSITSELKNNWGLNEIWKDLLKPRFERLEKRLEKILNKQLIIKEANSNKYHFDLSINKKLEKDGIKRLDHRHHALDAIIIAATTREHIRYLNTLNAADTDEEIKRYKLTLCKGKIRDFKLPWDNFVKDVREDLLSCIISFKETPPIVTKPFNKYWKWEIKNGIPAKKKVEQEKNGGGKWLAIRRSLFKEPLGIIWLKKIKSVDVKDALKIQTEWIVIKNDNELKKHKPYVYDDYAREYLEVIAERLNLTPENFDKKKKEIKKWLKSISENVNTGKINKNGKPVTKKIYNLDGRYYEKIEVAEFVRYKTKRMDLFKDSNKSFREKLTIQKMKDDLPYFVLEKEIIKNYPNIEQQLINEGYELEENKKNNPVNKLLLQHILEYNNNPKEAFEIEGLETLNKKAIKEIGKPFKSITRLDGPVRDEDIFRNAFYETDKGSIAYFVIYENQKNKERNSFESVSTFKAIKKIINGEPIAEDREGYNKIILSPGDIVYVPTNEEIKEIEKNNISIENLIKNKNLKDINERIYRVVKSTEKQCYFIKYNISELILPYSEIDGNKIGELDSQNSIEYTMDDDKIPIKKHCVKIKINRLGEIKII